MDLTSANSAVSGAGSFLRVTGGYSQSAGDFSITSGGGFRCVGDFGFTGGPVTLSGTSFVLEAPATSSVHAHTVTMQGNATRTLGAITAAGPVSVSGGILNVLNDYTRTASSLTISVGARRRARCARDGGSGERDVGVPGGRERAGGVMRASRARAGGRCSRASTLADAAR